MLDHLAYAVAFDDRPVAVAGDDRGVSALADVPGDGDVRRAVAALERVAEAFADQAGKVHGHGPVVVVVVVVVELDVVVVELDVDVVLVLVEVVDVPVVLEPDDDEAAVVVVASEFASVIGVDSVGPPVTPGSASRGAASRCSARRSLYKGASPFGRRLTDADASEMVPRSPGRI